MPQFQNNAYQPPILLQHGVPSYLFGSFSQQRGNTKVGLSTNAIASNVATITGQFLSGPLPAVGDLISIINSVNSSGAFNVNRAAITSVSYNAATNVMTISFALTGANQGVTVDSGTVIVEPSEVPEAIVNNGFSRAVAPQPPSDYSQFTLPVSITFPTLPTAVTVAIQGAIKSQNQAEWTTLGTLAVVAAGAQTVGPFGQVTLQRGYIYRLSVTGLSGTGTVVAKVG